MIITADLTTGTPVLSSDKVGEIGENNAVTLKIYPERDMLENENIVSYCVKFLVADGIMASQTYPQGNPIEISLWSALTDMEILSWQLEANDSDGNLVMKSVIVNQYLDPSLVGSLVTPGTTEQSLISQVGAFAAELADVEAEVAGKQDELTFDDVPTMDSDNPVKSGGVYQALAGKQNTLTAGENIHIEDDVIRADGYELPYASSSVKGGVTIDNKSVIMSGGTQLRSVMIEIKGSSGNVSVYSPIDLKMLATSKRAMCWNNDPIIACTSDGISAGFVFYFIKDGGILCKGSVSGGLGPTYSVTISEIVDVNDLSAVPTNVSAFTNDAGYCVPLTTEEMATVISSVVDIVSVNGDVLATDSNTILYL